MKTYEKELKKGCKKKKDIHGESKILQCFGHLNYNFAALDAFAAVIKGNKQH